MLFLLLTHEIYPISCYYQLLPTSFVRVSASSITAVSTVESAKATLSPIKGIDAGEINPPTALSGCVNPIGDIHFGIILLYFAFEEPDYLEIF